MVLAIDLHCDLLWMPRKSSLPLAAEQIKNPTEIRNIIITPSKCQMPAMLHLCEKHLLLWLYPLWLNSNLFRISLTEDLDLEFQRRPYFHPPALVLVSHRRNKASSLFSIGCNSSQNFANLKNTVSTSQDLTQTSVVCSSFLLVFFCLPLLVYFISFFILFLVCGEVGVKDMHVIHAMNYTLYVLYVVNSFFKFCLFFITVQFLMTGKIPPCPICCNCKRFFFHTVSFIVGSS